MGEEQVSQGSYLEMIKEEQTLGLEFHEGIGVMPIVLQEERVEDRCYHDQQTSQPEAPFFISTVSPLAESEIDLLLNISSQVNSSKFDEDLQQPCQSSCSQDYNDCPSSGFLDLSSPQSLFKKDNIQEVDQPVEKQVQVKAENFNEVDPICQEEVKWHDCHDQLAGFLQPSQKMVFLLFIKTEFGFTFSFKFRLQHQFSVWYKHNLKAWIFD